MSLVESYNVTIPWPEVYVHFMAVAYEADHHPQKPCYLGQVREFSWRDISVEPVKYTSTVTVPGEHGTHNLARETGWMSFDVRDTHRSGPPISGVPQPNAAPYDLYASLAYCSALSFFCPSPVSSVALQFDNPRSDAPARMQLLYDIRSIVGTGTATLTINGRNLGELPPASSVSAATGNEWVHRSIDVDPALLRAGANDVHIALAGTVQLDRMQVELSYLDSRRRLVAR